MNLSFFKKKRQLPEKIFEGETLNVRDFIAPSSIEIQQGHFKVGERLGKSFFVFSYPRYLVTGWFAPVVNLDTPLDISFFIHPIDTALIMKQLRKKVTEVQAEMIERGEKGLIRDPILETAFQDLEALRDGLMTSQEKMFRFGLYVTVFADSEKQLRDVELTLRSILEGKLIYIKPAFFQQKEGFVSTSPYGLDLLQVHNPMNTSPLSSTFPFISFDLSSNEGVLYGINRHNNSLILFDRFSLENANMVLFAKSGSGKSILGFEPVLIKERGGTRLTNVGPLVDDLIKKQGATKIDEELEGVVSPEIEVYGFNKSLKTEWSRVTVAARKTAPLVFYKFKTKAGREITTTGDHNLVVLKNGNLITTKGSEAKVGDFIPLPRGIAQVKEKPISVNLFELFKDSPEIYVRGGTDLIRIHYRKIKESRLANFKNFYLQRYLRGSAIPIKLFLQILECLKIEINAPCLKSLKITNEKNRCPLPIFLPIDQNLTKLAGYIASEGTTTSKRILISNLDTEVINDACGAFQNLGIPFTVYEKGVYVDAEVFAKLIKTLGGGGKSGKKKVWPLIFNLEKGGIAKYLTAYFEGDGGVGARQIVAVSKSKTLISEIAYLLLYFGIIGRIAKTRKRATNSNWKRKRTYWKISISGQDNLRKFAENINFISEKKRNALAKIITKNGNTNVDIIPGIAPILQEIYNLFGFQLHKMQDFIGIKNSQFNPSPEKLKEIISLVETRIQNFKSLAPTYKVLSELPELATIINLGASKKKLNRDLWQNLGYSWQLAKKGIIKPRWTNVQKMMGVICQKGYPLSEMKSTIHSGFREMDLPMKYYCPSLQPALIEYPESNTSYEMIENAAKFVWQNYQTILLEKIPAVEEKLAQLKVLANADLFWDPIAKIQKIENKKEKYVYDLTVDNEVFLAGQGGMFVHNSYAAKLEILRSLMTSIDVIVVDPENEYKYLADSVGGSFFNISLSSENNINPFDLPLPREDEKPEDVLRSNVINLVGLLRIMLGGLTAEEDAIMDRALTETYAAKDISPYTDPSKWEENIPILSDLEEVLETMEGAESLVRRLRKFSQGTFSQFFNQKSNISLDKNLVVFGIRDMEDELRPMAMFVVMRYIWNKIRSELKKRMLLIDEAWWMMQSPDSASFLFGIAKRARKYWLGVTTITQDVGDFLRSEYGVPIISNSSLQLLLKQSPAVIDLVKKTFNLTDEEKMLLIEAGIGEGIFVAGQKHVAIRVVASYAEDQIITTAPEEVLRIRKAKEEEEGY